MKFSSPVHQIVPKIVLEIDPKIDLNIVSEIVPETVPKIVVEIVPLIVPEIILIRLQLAMLGQPDYLKVTNIIVNKTMTFLKIRDGNKNYRLMSQPAALRRLKISFKHIIYYYKLGFSNN